MSELKPCPSCGWQPQGYLRNMKDGRIVIYRCSNDCCGLSHRSHPDYLDGFDGEIVRKQDYKQADAYARERWNTRFLEDAKDAEVARLKERVEWQPIDTFPSDDFEGEFMLLSNERCYSPCVFQKGGVISEDDFWIVWRAGDFDEVKNPTHWMPVPTLPAQSNKEG
jgi:hypothetical protein